VNDCVEEGQKGKQGELITATEHDVTPRAPSCVKELQTPLRRMLGHM